jgi:hypothetical protein
MSPATGPVRRNSAVPAVWKRKLGPFPLQRVRLEALDEDADFAAIVDSTFSLFAHDELEKRKGRIDDRGEIRVLVERFEADSLKRERA